MSEEYTDIQRVIVKSKITGESYSTYLNDYDNIEFGVKNSIGKLKLYIIIPLKYIKNNNNKQDTLSLLDSIGFCDLYKYVFRNIREITKLDKKELSNLLGNKFILDDEWGCNTELRFICCIDSLKIKRKFQ